MSDSTRNTVYLRKLNKKFFSFSSEKTIREFVAELCQHCFFNDHTTTGYSLFHVTNSEIEFTKISVCYNSSRVSQTSEITWLILKPEDIMDAGLVVKNTSGLTKCSFANSRHVDLVSSRTEATTPSKEEIINLFSIMTSRLSSTSPLQLTSNEQLSFSKNEMRSHVESAKLTGCNVANGLNDCLS